MSPNIPRGKAPYAGKFKLRKLANRIFNGNPYFQTFPTFGRSVNLTLPGIGTFIVRGNANLSSRFSQLS